MKHIAFLIDDITHGGGTERVTTQLANMLAEKYKVSILSMKTSEKEKFQSKDQIEIISFYGERIKNKCKQRLHTGIMVKKLCYEKSIDVLIVVETYKVLNLIPFMRKIKESGIVVIVWEHFNYFVDRKYSIKWFARYFSAKYADCVVVLGQEDLKNFQANLRKIKRIEYIYNPVAFEIVEKKRFLGKYVLAVGRLEEQKGFDYLLDIWKIIEEQGLCNGWKLRIIGNGSKEQKLERQAEELGLKNLEMLPFQKNIQSYYQKSDIFVLTSRYEGFVLVLLEAQANGLPAISFNVKEGPKEIIDNGINGYLVEAFDIRKFAEKLQELMLDEKKRMEMSNYSQKDLERFHPEKIVLKWEELIEDLCK